MLVLSRKIGEFIHIGHDIVVTVVDIRGDKCRLGIEAPPDTPVHRAEVYEQIRRDGRDFLGHLPDPGAGPPR